MREVNERLFRQQQWTSWRTANSDHIWSKPLGVPRLNHTRNGPNRGGWSKWI